MPSLERGVALTLKATEPGSSLIPAAAMWIGAYRRMPGATMASPPEPALAPSTATSDQVKLKKLSVLFSR